MRILPPWWYNRPVSAGCGITALLLLWFVLLVGMFGVVESWLNPAPVFTYVRPTIPEATPSPWSYQWHNGTENPTDQGKDAAP